MKVYVVHKGNSIEGVYTDKEKALKVRDKTSRSMALSGYRDDRVYITVKILDNEVI